MDLSQVDEDSSICYGDNEITTLCEQFDLDVDDTLVEWNNLKEMVQSEIEKCNSKYLLKLLTKHLATVGNIYPNLFKLLCVSETLHNFNISCRECFPRCN